jgi:hypothetical protein
MFAAEQENWHVTQEKMSQSVLPSSKLTSRSLSPLYFLNRAQRIHAAPRIGNRRGNAPGAGSQRSSNEHQSQTNRFHPYSDRPIPQGYVCYRCGQKGDYLSFILLPLLTCYRALDTGLSNE